MDEVELQHTPLVHLRLEMHIYLAAHTVWKPWLRLLSGSFTTHYLAHFMASTGTSNGHTYFLMHTTVRQLSCMMLWTTLHNALSLSTLRSASLSL